MMNTPAAANADNLLMSSSTAPSNAQMQYTPLAMLFVGLLLSANVIGEKPLLLGPFIVPAGLLLFPMTYLLGDVLTELYGFAASRRVIWMAMLCNLFMCLMCKLSISLPALPSWSHTEAYAQILGSSSRLMAISVFSYFCGELSNASIVSRLKLKMKGRLFWLRALCGSWIGELIETSLFIPLAFYGRMPNEELLRLALFYYAFKVSYALCAMPMANKLVQVLKRPQLS